MIEETPEEIRERIFDLAKQIRIVVDPLSEEYKELAHIYKELPEDMITWKTPPFYRNKIEAKVAIADFLGMPLAKLSKADLEMIDKKLSETLEKYEVMKMVKEYFSKR